jgi:hypothetical protein
VVVVTTLFTPWDQFDPIEYVRRNYGLILPEDRKIIKFVIGQLKRYGITPGVNLHRVADIGAGPNFYPSMIMAPLLDQRGGIIDLIEYAQPNRDFLDKLMGLSDPIYRNQTRYGDQQVIHTHEPWHQFSLLIHGCYKTSAVNPFRKARESARVIEGSIYQLSTYERSFQYDLVSSYFVAESITADLEECMGAIYSVVHAARPDGGVFVIAFMLGSEGYPAGVGTNFPAVSLTVKDLRKIFSSMSGIDYKVVSITSKEDEPKARDGYHGMAVAIGRRQASPLLVA